MVIIHVAGFQTVAIFMQTGEKEKSVSGVDSVIAKSVAEVDLVSEKSVSLVDTINDVVMDSPNKVYIPLICHAQSNMHEYTQKRSLSSGWLEFLIPVTHQKSRT